MSNAPGPQETKKINQRAAYIRRGHGTKADQFRFVLKAANNETVATSEHYVHKQDAIATIKTYFPDFVIVDKTKSRRKK